MVFNAKTQRTKRKEAKGLEIETDYSKKNTTILSP